MKKFKFLMYAIVAVLACCSLTSCSDDDDKDKDDDEVLTTLEAQLIGKWTTNENGFEWGYIFNRDKTGLSFEGDQNGNLWSMTWRVSGKTIIIIDEDGDREDLTVSYIDDDSMYAVYDGRVVEFHKGR